MPFQAVATQRLYEQVAGQVTELVTRGEFKPGDRLPPERDLAKVLGVSRPTVREAMIALEIAGLVEVRVGAGTFITDRAAAGNGTYRFDGTGASPLQAIAARRMIEPSVAALAIANGKLAPHSNVGKKIVLTVRKTSRSKLNHGFSDSHGSTGQYGRTCVMMYAVPVTEAASTIWQPASANRG